MSIRHIAAVVVCLTALAWAETEVARAGTEMGARPDSTTRPAALVTTTADGEVVPVDEIPKPIRKVPPQYPKAARKHGDQGRVEVMAFVAKSGKVTKVKVAEGKGLTPELDKAALAAVRQWVFTPALAKGKPVAVWIVVPVMFRLH